MVAIRVYLVIHAATTATPTEQQWRDLISGTKGKPMASAIVSSAKAAQNHISATKRNEGTDAMRYTMGGFELSRDDVTDLLAVLDTEALVHSVTGTNVEKFEGVLEAELQDAATDLGYAAQAANISVTVISATDPDAAELAVQAYLVANAGIWYAA